MSEQQEAYLETLLQLARRDAKRAVDNREDGARRSIALWMADEVERQAADMGLPPEVAKGVRQEVRSLRERVRRDEHSPLAAAG
jgi:hypothetical protein